MCERRAIGITFLFANDCEGSRKVEVGKELKALWSLEASDVLPVTAPWRSQAVLVLFIHRAREQEVRRQPAERAEND